jgi:hypothetical protein
MFIFAGASLAFVATKQFVEENVRRATPVYNIL